MKTTVPTRIKESPDTKKAANGYIIVTKFPRTLVDLGNVFFKVTDDIY